MGRTLATPFRYQITIRDVIYGADSLKMLSHIYCLVRDASGEGCSTFPPVTVREHEQNVGYISYNGRIWDGRLWNGCCDFTDNSKLLFDNHVEAA